MENWPVFFKYVFNKIEVDFSTILSTIGCREGWLQGEFYRISKDENFSVNYFKLPCGGRADLYGKSPSGGAEDVPMVAEIKIVGGTYLSKNIDGHGNLERFIINKNGIIRPTKNQIINSLPGSILGDIKRLNNVKGHEKYFILVIPKCEKTTKLGEILEKISFSDIEFRYPYKCFDVKIWRLI